MDLLPAAGLGRVPLLEALDASGGVDQLLLAGEERMAGGADLQAHLVLGGVGLEGVAARAVTVTMLSGGWMSFFTVAILLFFVVSPEGSGSKNPKA